MRKTSVKKVITRIVCVMLVLFAALAAALYYYAVFDFTFIKRPTSWPQTPDYIYGVLFGKNETPDNTADATKDPTTDPTVTEDAAATADPTADATKDPYFADAKSLFADGFEISDLPYVKGTTLLGKTDAFPISDKFSLSTKLVKVLYFDYASESAIKEAKYKVTEADRLTAEVYMGYVLIDNGVGVYIFDQTGKRLTLLPNGYEPAYTRDKTGRPLFSHSVVKEVEYVDDHGIPSTITLPTEEYYYVDDATGHLTLSDYNPATDSRGLYFDYPAYYGVSTSDTVTKLDYTVGVKFASNGTPYVVYNKSITYQKSGAGLSNRAFKEAFAFSEGVSFATATVDYRGSDNLPFDVAYLVDENGNVIFDSQSENYNEVDRYILSSVRLPASTGPESIGSLYFDHGLIRVRRVDIDWFNFYHGNASQKVYSDEDILIDKYGRELPIPYGFEIKAYSDGMILLEKNGSLGYMDYTGAWVIQPDLISAEAYYEGLAVVTYADGRVAMIDTDGNEIIPAGEFTYISHASSGIITAYGEDGWSVFYKMDPAA